MNTSVTSDFEARLVSPAELRNPYPLLHEMREKAPVYWSESIGGWVLTRYDDILVSFKDTASYSNENRLGKAAAYLPPEKRANFKPFEDHYKTKGLLHSDPPDHTRLRALVTKEFTPSVVEKMRPRMQKVVDDMIDSAIKRGSLEVISEFASPLPIGVISEILGVPPEDRHLLSGWADDMVAFQGVNRPSEADLTRAQNALAAMRPYILKMIEDRRRQPREDLISKFVAAESAGERLSEAELINTCVTLFVAGHETTIAAISNSIYALLSHPEQLALLRCHPDLLAPAIEEVLRFESPISRQPRRMKADAELGGNILKEGEMVFQMLNAANRDPAYFTNPDVFDIRREKNKHIAFGYGAHFCAGAVLARSEAFVAVGTFFRRLHGVQLVDIRPNWEINKRNSRVLKSLAVSF
jgi:hypothetical protein